MEKLSLGEFISILRKGKGLKQEELAEKLGVSAKTISSWENNRTYPDIMMLPILAEFFDISVDELIRGEKKNTIVNKNDEDIINNKSLLKIKKLKYAKYKERSLLYTLLAVFSSIVGITGLCLSCFVALWTLVFAVLGFLGMATLLVLEVINSKHYLNNEGILTSEDYTEENYDKILNCRVNNLRSFILSFIPLFIYGLVLLLCYLWNNNVYIYEVLDLSVDYTTSAITWGIVCLSCGFIGICVSFIIYVISNVKYGNEKQKSSNKKNCKLVFILAASLCGSIVLSSIILPIHDEWGPVENIYHTEFVYDTYEEITEKLSTYTIRLSTLRDAGLENGKEYVLNFPNEYLPSMSDTITDVGNGFVYASDIYYDVHKCSIYDDTMDSDNPYYYYDDDLIEAYLKAENKNNIEFNYEDLKTFVIPIEAYVIVYNSEIGFYYIDFVPGKYTLDEDYTLEVYSRTRKYGINDGLYYRFTEDTLINKWIECFDTELEYVRFTVYKEDDFEKYKHYIVNISNSIYVPEMYAVDYILNIRKNNSFEWRYITNGINEGKYGYCSLTYYYVSELIDGFIVLLLSVGLLIEIILGFILWDKQKYQISFK